jgi:hypothetical protein
MTDELLKLTDGCLVGGAVHLGVGEGGPGQMQTQAVWTSSVDGTLTFWQLKNKRNCSFNEFYKLIYFKELIF